MNRVLGIVVLFALAVASHASPIFYSFSGNVSGNLGGTDFTNKNFVITLSTDTTLIDHFNNFHQTQVSPTTVSIDGFSMVSVLPSMNPAVFYNNTSKFVGIGKLGDQDWLDIGSNSFTGWDLASPIGPITGNVIGVNQFHDVATTGGLLMFNANSISTATFQASAVPEPATLAVIGAGIVAMLRRRRK
ncbi:MAG: PEP-CTERM sorting domain-containing protein [Fimbriimonadaceae bacterium]